MNRNRLLGLLALATSALALGACGVVGGSVGNGKVSLGCATGGHCTAEDIASIKEGQNQKKPETWSEAMEVIFWGPPESSE